MAAQQQLLLLLFSHTQDYLSESDSMVALHDQVRDVCLSVCIFACCMCVLVCAQAWEHVCVCVCMKGARVAIFYLLLLRNLWYVFENE